jgi:hypothetical protein
LISFQMNRSLALPDAPGFRSSKRLRSPFRLDSKFLFATTISRRWQECEPRLKGAPTPSLLACKVRPNCQRSTQKSTKGRISLTRTHLLIAAAMLTAGKGSQLRAEGKYRRDIEPTSSRNEGNWEKFPLPLQPGELRRKRRRA